jgi:hypothetical protein
LQIYLIQFGFQLTLNLKLGPTWSRQHQSKQSTKENHFPCLLVKSESIFILNFQFYRPGVLSAIVLGCVIFAACLIFLAKKSKSTVCSKRNFCFCCKIISPGPAYYNGSRNNTNRTEQFPATTTNSGFDNTNISTNNFDLPSYKSSALEKYPKYNAGSDDAASNSTVPPPDYDSAVVFEKNSSSSTCSNLPPIVQQVVINSDNNDTNFTSYSTHV